MDFEWHEAKSEENRRERGFGFDFAALIFEGPTLEQVDTRRDYGEVRVQAIGEADGFVLFVVYTNRGETRRIISARMADARERSRWQSFANR